MGRDIKIGVHLGDGPTPGYLWNVLVIDIAFEDAMKILNEEQYEHLAEQMQELARQNDPTRSLTISLDAVEDFHELRDKGGVLGSLNIRVFFMVDKMHRALVVLGAVHKQNDGPTPMPIKKRMQLRMRRYLAEEYGVAEINEKRTSSRKRGGGGSE